MKGKFLNLLALLLVASMLLAACGGGTVEEPKEEPMPEATEEVMPEATEEPMEEPSMPEEVTVTIGFTSSITGSQEVSSKRQVNGFTLWMNQVNDA